MITGDTPRVAHNHLSKQKKLSNEAEYLSMTKLDLYCLPNKKNNNCIRTIYKHIVYCDIDKYIIYMHYTAILILLLILSRFIGLPRYSYLPAKLPQNLAKLIHMKIQADVTNSIAII